jgi:hypothetical protein
MKLIGASFRHLLAVLFLGWPLSHAGVVTGSFYLAGADYPALFETRRSDTGDLLAGAVLFDDFFEMTNTVFAADGTLRSFDGLFLEAGSVYRFEVNLEQQRLFHPFLGTVSLATIVQNVSSNPPSGEIRIAIRRAGSNVELTWRGEAGESFQIESKSRITNAWSLVAIETVSNAAALWQEPISPTNGFYRVSRAVVINGRALSKEQLAEFESIYQLRPLPGSYWYDATSGLYGAAGFPAYGFLRAGHDFGPIPRDASIGNTGVVLNGRELSLSEWWVWSLIVKQAIPAGSYWLDSEGNAGEGATPSSTGSLGNLYTQATTNEYTGAGASGDNFWSTRFSAGNHDPSQGVGYVSVPGHGPVGYGF